MLSHELKQAAGAMRLMKDAPAADLREALSRVAEVLDAAADHIAAVEKGVPARYAPRTTAREMITALGQLAIRSGSAALRGSAPPRALF